MSENRNRNRNQHCHFLLEAQMIEANLRIKSYYLRIIVVLYKIGASLLLAVPLVTKNFQQLNNLLLFCFLFWFIKIVVFYMMSRNVKCIDRRGNRKGNGKICCLKLNPPNWKVPGKVSRCE